MILHFEALLGLTALEQSKQKEQLQYVCLIQPTASVLIVIFPCSKAVLANSHLNGMLNTGVTDN